MKPFQRFFRSGYFVSIMWIVAIIVAWELGAFVISDVLKDKLSASKLPFLHSIIGTIFDNAGLFFISCVTTLSRAFLGFVAGAFIGFLLGIAMSLCKQIEKIAYPYLLLSQMVPILGLAPVVISIVRTARFGDITIPASDITRIFIAAYITFFPVATNILAGLKSVDQEKRSLMFSYASSMGIEYRKLMLPFSIPYLFSGLKIAAPLAVTASILVDSLGAAEGIGYLMTYSLYTGTYMIFWASVICSASMGILGYFSVVALESLCMPWKQKRRSDV